MHSSLGSLDIQDLSGYEQQSAHLASWLDKEDKLSWEFPVLHVFIWTCCLFFNCVTFADGFVWTVHLLASASSGSFKIVKIWVGISHQVTWILPEASEAVNCSLATERKTWSSPHLQGNIASGKCTYLPRKHLYLGKMDSSRKERNFSGSLPPRCMPSFAAS